MNDAQARGDQSVQGLGKIWLDLEPRRGILFVINIGPPILIGLARGETRGAFLAASLGCFCPWPIRRGHSPGAFA
jgi:hypothetical protein